ncbi:30S ribosomal protein S20 [Acidaminobacter sp.]|jgi:small subunit ribosomal protein S20|uniref:30S ribosomal protein S20 n=1 Tax=Acidaminobacter sp. TaxID=1872102 RepID=UPI00138270BD|nr:30S ribosomal protein S20 [Acidaminobacter sp.]MDK9709747.1 30S ribosomal protein S20 [Acidaminobacter sp.]MZQ96896.1 30S ribosomal protein S20 [Acidaminobacter sp.]
MANIKSAEKRISVIKKKTLLNKSRKSALKTAEKRFLEAIAAGNKALAQEKLTFVEKKLSQAASKGTIHKNAASRKISRLNKRLKDMIAG